MKPYNDIYIYIYIYAYSSIGTCGYKRIRPTWWLGTLLSIHELAHPNLDCHKHSIHANSSAYSAAPVDAPKVPQIKTQAKALAKSPITFSSIQHPIKSKLGYQCARIVEHKVAAECLCLMTHLDVGSSSGIWSDPATVVCASRNRWCTSSCQLQGQNHSRAHTAELTISHHAAKLALIWSSVQTDCNSMYVTLADSVRTEIGNQNKNKNK